MFFQTLVSYVQRIELGGKSYAPSADHPFIPYNREFCQFVETANKNKSSALMVLSLKLPDDKETLISKLKENVAFSKNELIKEQNFLSLVDLNDKNLTKAILDELSKAQKETIGRKALLRSLEKKHLESVLPLISDQEVPLSTPESTSSYLYQVIFQKKILQR